MTDILEIPTDGRDMYIQDSVLPKSVNVLSVQLGSLEYLPDFGVDFNFFLTSEFQIQNDSFKAHLVDRLVRAQVNVAEVIETVETLFRTYVLSVSDAGNQNSGGLIS